MKLRLNPKPCHCSVYEALAAELVRPLGCASCTLDAEAVAVLNDKIKFSAFCEGIGMRVPRSFPVTSPERLYELNARWRPRMCAVFGCYVCACALMLLMRLCLHA